ncbi:cardiolipin synthase, partial [Scheffersomyces stipitis CBS 6054]
SLWTIPNILTYTRIITTPFIGYFIVQGETSLALSLFVYSSITDFVDGYIARRFNMKSVVGSIIDPLADKFLMTVCTLSLAYVSSIPALVASVIIGRDVMLSFMSFYYRYKSLEPPRTLDKFISIRSNPTITVHPNLLGKINTGLQMVYIGGLVFKPAIESFLGIDLETAALGMGTLVSATTLLSGITYVLNRNSFKYIK